MAPIMPDAVSFCDRWLDALRDVGDLPPLARLVGFALEGFMDASGRTTALSPGALASATGVTVETSMSYADRLVAAGYLEVVERHGRGGRTRVYKAKMPDAFVRRYCRHCGRIDA